MGVNGEDGGGRPILEARYSGMALVSLLCVALATVVMAALLASPAHAETYTVTNTSVSGADSLRQAIIDANANPAADTIDFDLPCTSPTITVASGPPFVPLPDITASGGALTIDGGRSGVTVSNGDVGIGQVFVVDEGAKLTINRLSVTKGAGCPPEDCDNGAVPEGGGIYNAGSLEVNSSTISDSITYKGGGGIYNAGSLEVVNSTISDNTDFSNDNTHGGGGISSADGSSLTVVNSTIADNTAFFGGGIYTHAAGAKVWNTTIFGNSATNAAAGIAVGSPQAHITLWNTLLALNRTQTSSGIRSTNCFPYPLITNGGNNLDSGGSCHFGTANHSLSNTDSQLGTARLADNGGPTKTVALPRGPVASPAINAGNNAFAVNPDDAVNPGGDLLQFDQRGAGFARIVDGNVDIGAFEVQVLGSEPPPTGTPEDKQACKKGGYEEFGFRNQGQCIKAVNHAN
jgi:hypothetical protein